MPDLRCRVTLDNRHQLVAYSAGKMRKHPIRILAEDKVTLKEGLHNLLRERIAALRGVGFGRFASHRLRRCEPSPKLRFRSLA